MGGWTDGWMGGLKAVLRITYSNKKRHTESVGVTKGSNKWVGRMLINTQTRLNSKSASNIFFSFSFVSTIDLYNLGR